MSDQPKRIFTKASDYATVYADSVIFQGGTDISKLIFFQREVEPTEDGAKLETKPEKITLKFEVRVPRVQLFGLAKNIEAEEAFREQGGNLVRLGGEDHESIQAWYNLSDKLDDVLIDAQGQDIGDVHQADIQAGIDRLKSHLDNRRR